VVIWVTGLSGAGKSALCDAIHAQLKARFPALVRLDGDVVREAFGGDLGYTEADRKVQIGRMQRMARLLCEQGVTVLVAALYAHPELLDWNRRHIKNYFEVYLEAPLELVRRRDAKGLYAAAAAGKTKDVVGLDIPWHAPRSADLVIQAQEAPAPAELARQVISAIPWN